MKFSKALVCGIATLALSGSLALVGCSSDTSSTDTSSDDTATEEEATDDATEEAEEAAYDVEGEWIYYAEVVSSTVYGDVTNTVSALTIELSSDGTVTVTPDSDNGGAYSSDSGTYEVSGETVTLTLDTYGTVTGTLVDDDEMEIDAGTFSSDDTETYSFLLY